MRRYLLRFLPAFWLALTVQILAPVGACLARATAATDPLASAILCQGAAGDHVIDQQQNHHMRDGCCSTCAAAVSFSTPDPQIVPVAIIREAYRVAWISHAPDIRAAKLASSAQARGPPSQS